MTVHCPHCSTGYTLPDHLLGGRGSRVRCPQCANAFVVLRDGSVAVAADAAVAVAAGNGESMAEHPRAATATSIAPAPPAGAADPSDPRTFARFLLETLATGLADRLETAQAAGRVLAACGPDIVRAWEVYRERLGDRATPAVFREALKERFGVDLTNRAPR